MNLHQIVMSRLKKIFPTDSDKIEFTDDRGDGRHFTVKIHSQVFTGKPLIERQKMVYSELEDLIKKDFIHALRMELSAPDEAPLGNGTQSENAEATTDNADHPLAQLINKSPIMVFMKGDRFLPQCGFSARIIELLDELKTKYETFDILEDEEVRQGLKEFSNWPTYPQLYIEGKLIGGIDIASELHEKGQLEKMLEKLKTDAQA